MHSTSADALFDERHSTFYDPALGAMALRMSGETVEIAPVNVPVNTRRKRTDAN